MLGDGVEKPLNRLPRDATPLTERAKADGLAGYEKEWRELFESTLHRAWKRRQLLEKKWDRLERGIKHCWVAYREHYEEIE